MTEGTSTEYKFRGYRVLLQKAQILRGDEVVALTPKAVQMLITCIDHRDRVVTKEELLERVWPNVTVEEGNIAYTANLIRKTLGRDVLQTVSRLGYRFIAPIEGEAPEASSRTNLPIRERTLVGRDADLDRVAALLVDHPLVTLIGPPGVGKTSLARAAGRRALPSMPDGVWYLDVAGLPAIEALAGAVGAMIGVRLDAGEAMIPTLARAIGVRRMLLILDCCETVSAVVARLVETLIKEAPNLSVLATSRTVLATPGERVLRLRPLDTRGEAPNAAAALEIPAVALFVERAEAAQAGFVFRDSDAPIVAELCRSLDGLPLALEMVAARVSAIEFRVLRDRLMDFTLRSGSPLRSAFDFTWSLLPGREQQALLSLSVCSGSFDFEAARAIAGSAMTEGDFLECLGQLVDFSVVATEGGAVRRYRLLDTIRTYLAARLDEDARRRHFRSATDHYTASFSRLALDWERMPEREWLAAIIEDLDVLRGILTWAFGESGDYDRGLALVAAAPRHWRNAGSYAEGRAWFDRAIAIMAGRETPPAIRASILDGFGQLVGTADAGRAGDAFAEAARLFKAAGDPAGEGLALSGKGMMVAFEGDFPQAERILRRAVKRLASVDRPKRYCLALENLAFVYASTDRPGEAAKCLRDASKASRETRDAFIRARIELGLAELAYLQGDPEEAAARAEIANVFFASLGHHPLYAIGLVNEVRYLEASGEIVKATAVARHALPHARQRGDYTYVSLLELIALLGVEIEPFVCAGILGWTDESPVRQSQPRQVGDIPTYERLLASLREVLTPSRLASGLRFGEGWDPDEVNIRAEALLDAVDAAQTRRSLAAPLRQA